MTFPLCIPLSFIINHLCLPLWFIITHLCLPLSFIITHLCLPLSFIITHLCLPLLFIITHWNCLPVQHVTSKQCYAFKEDAIWNHIWTYNQCNVRYIKLKQTNVIGCFLFAMVQDIIHASFGQLTSSISRKCMLKMTKYTITHLQVGRQPITSYVY